MIAGSWLTGLAVLALLAGAWAGVLWLARAQGRGASGCGTCGACGARADTAHRRRTDATR